MLFQSSQSGDGQTESGGHSTTDEHEEYIPKELPDLYWDSFLNLWVPHGGTPPSSDGSDSSQLPVYDDFARWAVPIHFPRRDGVATDIGLEHYSFEPTTADKSDAAFGIREQARDVAVRNAPTERSVRLSDADDTYLSLYNTMPSSTVMQKAQETLLRSPTEEHKRKVLIPREARFPGILPQRNRRGPDPVWQVCGINNCHSSFKRKSDFKRHRDDVHWLGEKVYQCDTCGFAKNTRSDKVNEHCTKWKHDGVSELDAASEAGQRAAVRMAQWKSRRGSLCSACSGVLGAGNTSR